MNSQSVFHSVLTPLSFLDRSREVYPNKVAIVYGEKRFTYAQFAARVNQLASALRSAGVEKGDRVAFLCPNIPPMLEAHFGVPLAGGVLVSINIRLKAEEIKYILNQSESSFLFVDTEFAETIRPILDELSTVKKIVNIADSDNFAPLEAEEYEAFLQSGSEEPVPWAIADEMEPISINYTSGTTGHSKGVMYSHRGAYINSLGETIETTLTPNSVYLWTLPMFHCNGWCFTWGVTAIGGTHICLRKFYPGTVWQLIAQENVTHLNAAPVLLIALLNHRDRPQKLSHPLTVTTAGAPPSPYPHSAYAGNWGKNYSCLRTHGSLRPLHCV